MYKKKGRSYLLAMLLLWGFAFFQCGSGKKVSGVMSNPRPKDRKVVKYGPFSLTKAGSIHNIKLTAYHLSKEWLWVSATIYNKKGEEVYGMTGDFWHETGYDSDGYWSESDRRESSSFVLEEAGEYTMEIETEAKKTWGSYSRRGWRNVSITIIEGEKSYWWLIFGGLFFFFLWIGSGVRSRSHSAFPFPIKL